LADRILASADGGGFVTARMVFYGDLYEREGVQGSAGSLADLTPAEVAQAEEFARVMLIRAARVAARPADREAAQGELARLEGSLGEEQGLGNVARSTVNALTRVRWFAPFGMALAQRFVIRSLVQVTRYLNEPELRDRVQARVTEHLGPDTKVLIGHSLGSVVAYEAACRYDGALPLLVTLGSPLGIRNVVYERLVPQPPRFPAPVQRWVNVAAEDDIVAVVPDLKDLFFTDIPAACVFEPHVTVENGSAPHDATHYLVKSAVGRPVADALEG